MPVNNELNTRKQVLANLGATGPSNNERAYAKTLAAGLSNVNVKTKAQVVALTPTAVANATDLATAQALANDLKVKVNAIIAALKA